ELKKTHLAEEFPHSSHIQLNLNYAQRMMSHGKADLLMEEILTNWQRYIEAADVVIVEGLVPEADEEYIEQLNPLLARVLACDVILVAARKRYTLAQLNDRIEMTASLFGGRKNPKVIGCIINKVGAPSEEYLKFRSTADSIAPPADTAGVSEQLLALPVFDSPGFICLGLVHWNPEFIAPRTADVARHLRADVLYEGELRKRRVKSMVCMARSEERRVGKGWGDRRWTWADTR